MTNGNARTEKGKEVYFQNLRAEMARKGVTGDAIAREIGVNPSTLSVKLKMRGRLRFDEAVRIRNAFFPDLTIDYLFDFRGLHSA